MKKYRYIIVFWAIKLICIILRINQQQKLMKKDTLTQENKREGKIKEKLSCEFVRINHDKKDYEYFETGKLCNNINEATKKLTKK